jgi:hypothetical protein
MPGKLKRQRWNKEKLTRRVCFRLSDSEYARVEEELSVCGVTVSELARKRLLGQHVASKADLAVLSELRRIAGLLKHIYNETGKVYSALTAAAIREITQYVRVLAEKQPNKTNDAEVGS